MNNSYEYRVKLTVKAGYEAEGFSRYEYASDAAMACDHAASLKHKYPGCHVTVERLQRGGSWQRFQQFS